MLLGLQKPIDRKVSDCKSIHRCRGLLIPVSSNREFPVGSSSTWFTSHAIRRSHKWTSNGSTLLQFLVRNDFRSQDAFSVSAQSTPGFLPIVEAKANEEEIGRRVPEAGAAIRENHATHNRPLCVRAECVSARRAGALGQWYTPRYVRARSREKLHLHLTNSEKRRCSLKKSYVRFLTFRFYGVSQLVRSSRWLNEGKWENVG